MRGCRREQQGGDLEGQHGMRKECNKPVCCERARPLAVPHVDVGQQAFMHSNAGLEIEIFVVVVIGVAEHREPGDERESEEPGDLSRAGAEQRRDGGAWIEIARRTGWRRHGWLSLASSPGGRGIKQRRGGQNRATLVPGFQCPIPTLLVLPDSAARPLAAGCRSKSRGSTAAKRKSPGTPAEALNARPVRPARSGRSRRPRRSRPGCGFPRAQRLRSCRSQRAVADGRHHRGMALQHAEIALAAGDDDHVDSSERTRRRG